VTALAPSRDRPEGVPDAVRRLPDTAGHERRGAAGSVATEAVAAGTTVAVFSGRIAGTTEVQAMPADAASRALQIDDELYLVDGPDHISLHPIRHRCEPNCHLVGATIVVASRPVLPGEALTIDYATCTGSSTREFECKCQAPSCRGKVTADDWMLPELQLRYRGRFSPFLAARINDLVAPAAGRRAFAL
jgi:uncharacterized protein